MSIFWTQICPFVALQFYEGTDDGNGTDDDNNNNMSKEDITTLLIGSAMLWTILNIVFLCTIDMSFFLAHILLNENGSTIYERVVSK